MRIFLLSIFLKNCSTIDLGWQERPLFGRAEDGRHVIVVHLEKNKVLEIHEKKNSLFNSVNMGHGKYMYRLAWMYITMKDCPNLHTVAIFKQSCDPLPFWNTCLCLCVFLIHVCVFVRPVCVCVCICVCVLTLICVSMRPVCETMAAAGCSTDSCQRSSLPFCTTESFRYFNIIGQDWCHGLNVSSSSSSSSSPG